MNIPTLNQYIDFRLGRHLSPIQQLQNMFARSFGAGSFDQFWSYWNPVYGYYLYYKIYKPLNNFIPRGICIILTFAFCGFVLHDLILGGWWIRILKFFSTSQFPIPFVTIWFIIMSIFVIVNSGLKISYSHLNYKIRLLLNGLQIIVPLLITIFITEVSK